MSNLMLSVMSTTRGSTSNYFDANARLSGVLDFTMCKAGLLYLFFPLLKFF